MNNATTEQPLPNQPLFYEAVNIHSILRLRYGNDSVVLPVVNDILKRAEKAQIKYKLEQMGLFAFNGRDALLDAYQEICDLIIYMLQVQYEDTIKMMRGELQDIRVEDTYVMRLLSEASVMREHLIEQGDFE